MSTFSAEWLTLREEADAAARSPKLTEAVARALATRRPLEALDLGAGTGSNVRYLAERFGGEQHWLLADHDARLLACVEERMRSWAAARGYDVRHEDGRLVIQGASLLCHVATRLIDLHRGFDASLFASRHLVTASALLDLVSDAGLRDLAARCRESGAAVLFALTYDGSIRCSPDEPDDETIRTLVNQHQRTDKGFGPAAGPDGATRLREYLEPAGYTMQSGSSDWVLTPGDAALQRALVDGWAEAAALVTRDRAMVARWRAARLQHIDSSRSDIVVGHTDIGGWR